MDTLKVFVYGTLKKGHCNFYLAEAVHPVKVVVPATLGGEMFKSPLGGYPILKLSDKGLVHGELLTWEGPTKKLHGVMRILDALESQAKCYARFMVKVETAEGPEEAWVYALAYPSFDTSRLRLVPDGRWLREYEG